jgi:hypothetical protein
MMEKSRLIPEKKVEAKNLLDSIGFIILILVACLGSKNSQSKEGRT